MRKAPCARRRNHGKDRNGCAVPGRVSSDPVGIYCQIDCSEDYAKNTRVVLSAQPYTGSVFTGWSADCSATGPCSNKLKADTTVSANFVRLEPQPLSLVTPYENESDMREINDYFNAQYDNLPWGRIHDGLDIYPQGYLKSWQAACSGKIDALELQQDSMTGNWQVEVAIACDEYVMDPEIGGYFIPLTNKYYFRTMSSDPAVGQAQLSNIMVALGQTVTQGDMLGYLKAVNQEAHLHYELLQFGQSEFHVLGVTGIPLCPQAQFSLAAQNSVLNLLHTAWPGAELCYQ